MGTKIEQGMVDPLVDIDLQEVGACASMLLCEDASWIRRRKLRVDFIDDVVVRMRQSVDFRIPDGKMPVTRTVDGREFAHLPLFVLRKAPQELTDFDLVDASHTALSLPTRQANAELSHQALLARARKVRPSIDNAADLMKLIQEIAVADPPVSLNACDTLIGSHPPKLAPAAATHQEYLANDSDFCFLARLVAWSSIVAMPVEITPGQKLLKLAYSEPIMEWTHGWRFAIRAGLNPLPAQVDLPFVGAQTFHLEAHPPHGMAIASARLAVSSPTGPRVEGAPDTGRSAHLYIHDGEHAQSAAAFLELGAQQAGFIDNARTACLAVTGVLALCIAFAHSLAQANKTVPTLLLFLPGLLATLVFQPAAHALTRRVVTAVRNATLVCACAAFLAAFWLIAAPLERRDPWTAVRADNAQLSASLPGRKPGATVDSSGDPISPALLSINGTVRLVAQPTRASEPQDPSTTWIRVVWGVLLLVSGGATVLVCFARGRAQP